MSNTNYWNNFFENSEREHDLENKNKIEKLIKKIYLNSFSLEDIVNLQSYIARDFNFFGIKSDSDFVRFLADIQSRRRMLTTMQRAKLLAYLNNDLEGINIRLNNNPAKEIEGSREQMKAEIEMEAERTKKPEHSLEPNISLNSLKTEEDIRRNEAKILFDAITHWKRELRKNPEDKYLQLRLSSMITKLNDDIAKGKIDKEYYDSLAREENNKVAQVSLKDETLDRIDSITHEKRPNYNKALEFVNNLDISNFLTANEAEKEELIKNQKAVLDYMNGINHPIKDKINTREETPIEKEAFNNIDAQKIEEERTKAQRDAKHQEKLENFYNSYDGKIYQTPIYENVMESAGFKRQKSSMFNNIDAITGADKLQESENEEMHKDDKRSEKLEQFYNKYDGENYQELLPENVMESDDFKRQQNTMFGSIDAATGADKLPEVDNKEVILDTKDEVIEEAGVIFDEPIRLHTISDEVYTHRQILNTIDDIYRTNELYEKQIKHLGTNALSISLRREMLKEIKHNLKTLEKMKKYDEIYSKVLPLVEKIKIYEDEPETRETRKKLKHYKKEVIKLCGEDFEYFPAYFVTEINEKLSRAPKKLRIIKKEKVANVPNKKHLIGEAIKSISQRILRRKEANLDDHGGPIDSLISLGKEIAQNGINKSIIERLNNKNIDEAIDTFSSHRHISK